MDVCVCVCVCVWIYDVSCLGLYPEALWNDVAWLNQFCFEFDRMVSESVLSQSEQWWQKYSCILFYITRSAFSFSNSVCNFRQLTRSVSNPGPGRLELEQISTRERQTWGRVASAVVSARRRRCRSPSLHYHPDPGKRLFSCGRWRSGPAAVQAAAPKPLQNRHRQLWVTWQTRRAASASPSFSVPVARLSAG